MSALDWVVVIVTLDAITLFALAVVLTIQAHTHKQLSEVVNRQTTVIANLQALVSRSPLWGLRKLVDEKNARDAQAQAQRVDDLERRWGQG